MVVEIVGEVRSAGSCPWREDVGEERQGCDGMTEDAASDGFLARYC